MIYNLPSEIVEEITKYLNLVDLYNLYEVFKLDIINYEKYKRATKNNKKKLNSELLSLYNDTQFDIDYGFFDNVLLTSIKHMENVRIKILKCIQPEIYHHYLTLKDRYMDNNHDIVKLYYHVLRYTKPIRGIKYIKDDDNLTCPCGSTIRGKSLKRHVFTDKHILYLREHNMIII